MMDFLKIFALLVVVGAIALLASVDAGHVTIVWFNRQVETSGIVLLIVMALVCFISMGLMRMLLALSRVPQDVQHWREKREWARKEKEAAAAKTDVVVVSVKKGKPRAKK